MPHHSKKSDAAFCVLPLCITCVLPVYYIGKFTRISKDFHFEQSSKINVS